MLLHEMEIGSVLLTVFALNRRNLHKTYYYVCALYVLYCEYWCKIFRNDSEDKRFIIKKYRTRVYFGL